MKITIVASSLGAGGAERVFSLQALGFRNKGHEVTAITLYGKDHDFYDLPSSVVRLALNIAGDSTSIRQAIRNNGQRLHKLREAIISTQPDVVISHIHQTNTLTALALTSTRCPIVATEHTDARVASLSNTWRLLRRVAYLRLDRLVSVSAGVDSSFSWLPARKRRVIHNPVISMDEGPVDLPFPLNSDHKWVIGVGRLVAVKRFDLLISAFNKVASRHPDWNLLILGEGPLRAKLEHLVESLGLKGRVQMPGLVKSPSAVMRRCNLFAMASRVEGFPCALPEAMACGLPAIYTDCPSGPREIIRHGIDGILVPDGDTSAFAATLDRLMTDPIARYRLAIRAREVVDRFGLDHIMDDWQQLLSEVVSRH